MCYHGSRQSHATEGINGVIGEVTIFRLETKSSECLLTWLLIASRVFLRGPKKVSVNFYKPDRSNPDPIVANPMYFSDWREISRN